MLNKILIIGQSKTSQTEKISKFYANKTINLDVVLYESLVNEKVCLHILNYKNGILKKRNDIDINFPKLKLPSILKYILKYSLYKKSILKYLKNDEYDIFLGISLTASLLFKKNSKVKAYYCSEYYIKHENISQYLFNFLYKKYDIKLLKKFDSIINISPSINKARRSLFKNTNLYINKFFYTPQNYPIQNNDYKYNYNSKNIVFIGTISPNQYLKEFVKIINTMNQKYEFNLNFNIIGTGPYQNELIEYINKNNYKNVNLFGYIDSEIEVLKMIKDSLLGYALWNENKNDNSYYSDSGKPKFYTSIGIPVIISKHIYSAKFYKRFNAGIVVENEQEHIIKKLINYLNLSKNKKIEYHKNGKKLANLWDTNVILNKQFNFLKKKLDIN